MQVITKKALSIALSVLLLFAVMIVPVSSVSAVGRDITVSDLAELQDWMNDQQDGDVVTITNSIGLAPSAGPVYNGYSGFYMIITANNVTIQGQGDDVALYGDVYAPNGTWPNQMLILVVGDNVTLDNLTIMPKVQANKTIEVVGKGFTLSNCTITPNTKTLDFGSYTPEEIVEEQAYGGSIYFNGTVNYGEDWGDINIIGNTITNASITFDSMGTVDSLTIEGNTFSNDLDTTAIIGTVSWASPVRESTLNILFKDNEITDLPDGYDRFLRQRTSGEITLTLDGNTFPDDFDILDALSIAAMDPNYSEMGNITLIIDGQEYVIDVGDVTAGYPLTYFIVNTPQPGDTAITGRMSPVIGGEQVWFSYTNTKTNVAAAYIGYVNADGTFSVPLSNAVIGTDYSIRVCPINAEGTWGNSIYFNRAYDPDIDGDYAFEVNTPQEGDTVVTGCIWPVDSSIIVYHESPTEGLAGYYISKDDIDPVTGEFSVTLTGRTLGDDYLIRVWAIERGETLYFESPEYDPTAEDMFAPTLIWEDEDGYKLDADGGALINFNVNGSSVRYNYYYCAGKTNDTHWRGLTQIDPATFTLSTNNWTYTVVVEDKITGKRQLAYLYLADLYPSFEAELIKEGGKNYIQVSNVDRENYTVYAGVGKTSSPGWTGFKETAGDLFEVTSVNATYSVMVRDGVGNATIKYIYVAK